MFNGCDAGVRDGPQKSTFVVRAGARPLLKLIVIWQVAKYFTNVEESSENQEPALDSDKDQKGYQQKMKSESTNCAFAKMGSIPRYRSESVKCWDCSCGFLAEMVSNSSQMKTWNSS